MADRGWKKNERRIAAVLGGERVPVSGRGDGPDVAHAWLSIECKHRASIPAWLKDALQQARKAARDGQLPVAVLHEAGKHDSIVAMKLSDFRDWFMGEADAEEV